MYDHELEIFLFNEKSLNLYINKEELYKFGLWQYILLIQEIIHSFGYAHGIRSHLGSICLNTLNKSKNCIYSVSLYHLPKKNVYIKGHFFTGLTLVFGNLRYCLRLLVEKDPKLYINNWFQVLPQKNNLKNIDGLYICIGSATQRRHQNCGRQIFNPIENLNCFTNNKMLNASSNHLP